MSGPTPSAVMRALVDRVKQGQSVASFRAEFTDVIRAGAAAYHDGQALASNPHEDNTIGSDCWIAGWRAAAKDDE